MRYFTITRIEKWCEQRNMSRLIDALNNSDPEIRKASILCLGTFGDAIAVESLDYILNNDPDEFVQFEAKRAINNIQRIGIDSRIKLEPIATEVAYQMNIS